MKSEIQYMVVHSKADPVITVDSEVGAVYIYFKRCKVARTIERPSRNMILNVDLDSHDEVVGIEAIGAGEIEVRKLLQLARVKAPQIDWSNARVRSASSDLVHA